MSTRSFQAWEERKIKIKRVVSYRSCLFFFLDYGSASVGFLPLRLVGNCYEDFHKKFQTIFITLNKTSTMAINKNNTANDFEIFLQKCKYCVVVYENSHNLSLIIILFDIQKSEF